MGFQSSGLTSFESRLTTLVLYLLCSVMSNNLSVSTVFLAHDFMTSIISRYHEHDELILKTTSDPNPTLRVSGLSIPNYNVLKFGRTNLWSLVKWFRSLISINLTYHENCHGKIKLDFNCRNYAVMLYVRSCLLYTITIGSTLLAL